MLSNGDKIGPYIIRERAGQGGMATVYKAWHEGLHRLEALKVPRGAEQGAHDSTYVQRLLSEARVAAGLHHPHIVAIHSVSEPLAPIPFFAMDWVQGRDLAKILAEKKAFSIPDALEILESVASALDYAHSCGVVHRDIKPANILIAENGETLVPRVVDFGISRAAEDEDGAGETKLTKSGMIVGTPEYMSPEQAGSGAPVDFRTDLYSLAVVAYEMMCGAPPFTAGSGVSRFSVLISHVRDSAPLFEKCPDFPRAPGEVLLRALAKSPDDRPASCAAFVEELRAVAGQNSQVFIRHSAEENERTPFDSSRFERDESATVFERPVSLSAAPRTLTPQKHGPATLANSSDSIFSLRARLEAAGANAAASPEPKAQIALGERPKPESQSEVIPISASDSSKSEAIPQKMKDLPRPKRAPQPASRLAVLAGLGGVFIGGALVSMMVARNTSAQAESVSVARAAADFSASRALSKPALQVINPIPDAEKTRPEVISAPLVPVSRMRTAKVIRTREMPYETQVRRSDLRPARTRFVLQRGRLGAREVHLQISYQGEKEVGRAVVLQRTIRPSIPQIVVLGTRETPREIVSSRNPQKMEAPIRRARIRSVQPAPRRVALASRPVVKAARPRIARRSFKPAFSRVPITKRRRIVREAPLPP